MPPDPATAPDDGGWTRLGLSRDPAERHRRLERTLWLLVVVVTVAGAAVIAAILASGPSSEAILPPDAAATDAPLAHHPAGPIAGAPSDGDGTPEDRPEARDASPDDDMTTEGLGSSHDDQAGNDVGGDGSTDSGDVAGDGDGTGGRAPDGPSNEAAGNPRGADDSAPDGMPGAGGGAAGDASGLDDSAPDGIPGAGGGAAGDASGLDDSASDGGPSNGGSTHDDATDRAPPSPTEDVGVPAGWSEVARGFGLAFTRTSVGRDAWLAAMSSWLTPEQATEYSDVPIEAIPTGELVEVDVGDPGAAAHTHGRLAYDTGMVLEVGLSYRAAAGGWLVARVELAGTAGAD